MIVALLIYGSRLYKTRTALAGIPREWTGTEGKGVGLRAGKVVRELKEGLERSAWVAFEGRPRDLRGERERRRSRDGNEKVDAGASPAGGQLSQENTRPAWGPISHPGWSSPSSPDLPNLHYEPVILELPNLIEAKAVSLAPPDLLYAVPSNPEAETDTAPPPDPLAIELLQRPSQMGLRDYISHLTTLSMITPPSLGPEFVIIYEQARFSGEELDEIEFRGLMSIFAEILRNMKPLDASIVEDLHTQEEEMLDDAMVSTSSLASSDEDRRSFVTNETVEHTLLPEMYYTPRPDPYISDPESEDSHSRGGSPVIVHTAPSRPSAGRTPTTLSPETRASRRRGVRTPSIETLGRIRSNRSGSSKSSAYSGSSVAGSVIRLAEARTELDLPYEFVTQDEGG